MMSFRLRRVALLFHVVTSTGLLGAVAAFLALAAAGLSGLLPPAAVYPAMSLVTLGLVLPLLVLALVVGVVQAFTTPWGGIWRHGWIRWKLVLTLAALGILLVQLTTVAGLADLALAGDPLPEQSRSAMVLHAGGGLIVLLVATILSIYKPASRASLPVRASP